MNKKTVFSRFFEKIQKDKGDDGCWLWIGGKSSAGYGQFRLGYKQPMISAHRYIYKIYNNVDINGKVICHRCDNRQCVNPAHLFIGTQDDNMKDMKEKKRSCYGVKNVNSKLTDKDVIKIRNLYSSGNYSLWNLANLFGVKSHTTISSIVNRKTWSHVEGGSLC